MFCSRHCEKEYNLLKNKSADYNSEVKKHYRSLVEKGSQEPFYKTLSSKEGFCVCCGNYKKENKQEMLQTTMFVLVTLLPINFVKVIASQDKAVATEHYKK